MQHAAKSSGETIIANVIGRGPDIQLAAGHGGWTLSRWRQFVGSYHLPALPDPIFVVHIAGKSNVKTWDRDAWSEESSFPGCATIVPAGRPTGWLVDGELDVVTLSMSEHALSRGRAPDPFTRMSFAFSDPLGVALTRQVLGELYTPASPERDDYVEALVNMLQAHMLRGPAHARASSIPTTDFSAFRLHQVVNAILQKPGEDYSLERMAEMAGVTPSHLCRVFRKAHGMTPHQFVLRTKLDRAQQLLSTSNSSLGAIAETLGFTSQSHFTRAFRQFAGETPSEFRRRGEAGMQ